MQNLTSSNEIEGVDDLYLSDVHGAYEEMSRIFDAFPAQHIHFVGDVYDRGPYPDKIMDKLLEFDNIDVQWGNHDILWLGAALGHKALVANVVRICARYGNLSVLTENYGMDLAPLIDFANRVYADDPCVGFGLKGDPDLSEEQLSETKRVQKAMAFIQFKVEHESITCNPSFDLSARDLLHRIDFEQGTVELDGVTYELTDTVFPTIDSSNPYALTDGESAAIDFLVEQFVDCDKLQRHMELFLEKGTLYKIIGDHLVFHACVPLNEDGSFKEVRLFGDIYSGKSLFDAVDNFVRDAAYSDDDATRQRGLDLLWYLWLGEGSPLFAKSKMATFELYLIAEKEARTEVKNPFYKLLDSESVVDSIFRDFGMDPARSRMISGHTPIKVKDGEDPVRSHGRAVIIDGGMSKPYQRGTGIAGMSLTTKDGIDTLRGYEPADTLQIAFERVL